MTHKVLDNNIHINFLEILSVILTAMFAIDLIVHITMPEPTVRKIIRHACLFHSYLVYMYEYLSNIFFFKSSMWSKPLTLPLPNFSIVHHTVLFCARLQLRFSRPFRVLKLVYHSNSIRSAVVAIVTCAPILDVIVLGSLVIFTYAGLGLALYADRQDVPTTFQGIGHGIYALYVASTGDNYPMIAEPFIAVDPYNALFFITFLLISVLIVFAIPLAFILEWFKKNRTEQILQRRVVQKQALISAFICLDINGDGTLDLPEWEELLRSLSEDETQVKQCQALFDMLDTDRSGNLDIIEWFHLAEVRIKCFDMLLCPGLSCSCMRDGVCWLVRTVPHHAVIYFFIPIFGMFSRRSQYCVCVCYCVFGSKVLSFVFQMRVASLKGLEGNLRARIGKLEETINDRKRNRFSVMIPCLENLWLKTRLRAHAQFKLSFIARSPKFQAGILVIVVTNTIFVILGAVGVLGTEISSLLNYIFLIIFILEMVVKILGLGFAGYFVDPWNKVIRVAHG